MARVVVRFDHTTSVKIMTVMEAIKYRVNREDLIHEKGGEIEITLI